jgi:hypothetical protein
MGVPATQDSASEWRKVGAQVNRAQAINPDAYRHSLSAVILPPEQTRFINGVQAGLPAGKDVPRAGVIISRFSPFDPKQGVEFFFSPAINNINPIGVNDRGKWTICIGRIDDYPNNGNFWLTPSAECDIRLHLRMSGKVDFTQVNDIW